MAARSAWTSDRAVSEIVYIVTLRAETGAAADLSRALAALIERTLGEPGCVTCVFHRQADQPGVFMVYERWRDAGAFDEHMATPHVSEFLARANVLLAEPADVRAFEPLG
jgi:quinol monooxygenase YgiN